MIVSSIAVPSGALSEDLLAFINKTSILTPSFLHVHAFTNEIFGTIHEIVVSANQSTCMLYGVPIDVDTQITSLLDNGLLAAFFNGTDVSSEKEILKKVLESFPSNRVGVCSISPVSLKSLGEYVSYYAPLCCNLAFTFYDSDSEELVANLLAETKKFLEMHKLLNVYFQLPSSFTLAQISRVCSIHDRIHSVVVPFIKTKVTDQIIENPHKDIVSSPTNMSRVDVIDLFISTLRSDRPDGLYTTVVCDEHDVCLGLVYSNAESIRAAIVEEKGIYWSRSRGGLWRKGDTSGMYQVLLSVKADCDCDALRFSVIQKGYPPAFCHLNSRSCWGHEHGMHKLQSILQDRLRSAPPGSYTKRLFDDQTFLQKKLLEEAQELMEATEPAHIAAEAADVMYFMMTRCVAAGVTLRDIEHHLDRRTLKVTRRPGNAKEWRTENAAKILSSKSSTGKEK